MAPIPITIVTGFLGSGKTTLILQLVPQLRAANPEYRLALLKNEFGDVAVDSQLAASSAVSGVRELLNGCICCNLVGQLGDALRELGGDPSSSSPSSSPPNRIIVETSGSAFPATLALEVNRLARSTGGAYVLDGVVSVIDVENWQGYEDTSYTARLQARYTDLVVFNKWESCDERRFDECLDRLGDLHTDGSVAWLKSRRGFVDADLVFGLDGGLLAQAGDAALGALQSHSEEHSHSHSHSHDHQSEIDVISVSLASSSSSSSSSVDVTKLLRLLTTAPRDEVYRIKALLTVSAAGRALLRNSDDGVPVPDSSAPLADSGASRYILNWAFGRWTLTPLAPGVAEHTSSTSSPSSSTSSPLPALRMTVMLAQYEGTKWSKKLDAGDFFSLEEAADTSLRAVIELLK